MAFSYPKTRYTLQVMRKRTLFFLKEPKHTPVSKLYFSSIPEAQPRLQAEARMIFLPHHNLAASDFSCANNYSVLWFYTKNMLQRVQDRNMQLLQRALAEAVTASADICSSSAAVPIKLKIDLVLK